LKNGRNDMVVRHKKKAVSIILMDAVFFVHLKEKEGNLFFLIQSAIFFYHKK